MPCSYVIDMQKRLVITTAWDRVTFAEARGHQDQLKVDPSFNPDFNQLIDASAVTSIDATVAEIKRLAGRPIFSSTSRRAFLATSPDVFGVGRLMGAHLEMGRVPQHVRVFYDLAAALKWLGLEADPRPER